MKTIIDAVNYFKGEYTYDSNFLYFDENGFFGANKNYSVDENNYYICSREEFNQCVKEMTEMNCKQSVFTKEMQDNGESPEVGMKCEVFMKEERISATGNIELKNEKSFVFKYDDNGLCDIYDFGDNVYFQAIDNRTDKEKAIEHLTNYFCDGELTPTEHLYEELFRQIKAGEVPFIKWVGKE